MIDEEQLDFLDLDFFNTCPNCKRTIWADPEKYVFCSRKCLDEHNAKQSANKLIRKLKEGKL